MKCGYGYEYEVNVDMNMNFVYSSLLERCFVSLCSLVRSCILSQRGQRQDSTRSRSRR